jgi:hypothetical protein
MAAAGLLLGWRSVFVAIFIAALTACIIMIPLQRRNAEKQKNAGPPKSNGHEADLRRKCENARENEPKNREFPFGPFLSFGTVVSLLYGTQLMNWYLGLFGLR